MRLSGAAVKGPGAASSLDEPPCLDRTRAPGALPGDQPPPDLPARLEEHGIRPAEVAHVVITHNHADHYNGTTREREGRVEPCFPHARHYLGRADWDQQWLQEELRDPHSVG